MELSELMRDEAFKTAVEQARDSEEVAKLLQSIGFAVNASDVETVFNTESREMNERELETVTGGGLLSSAWSYISVLQRGGEYSSTGRGKGKSSGGAFGGGRSGSR